MIIIISASIAFVGIMASLIVAYYWIRKDKVKYYPE